MCLGYDRCFAVAPRVRQQKHSPAGDCSPAGLLTEPGIKPGRSWNRRRGSNPVDDHFTLPYVPSTKPSSRHIRHSPWSALFTGFRENVSGTKPPSRHMRSSVPAPDKMLNELSEKYHTCFILQQVLLPASALSSIIRTSQVDLYSLIMAYYWQLLSYVLIFIVMMVKILCVHLDCIMRTFNVASNHI